MRYWSDYARRRFLTVAIAGGAIELFLVVLLAVSMQGAGPHSTSMWAMFLLQLPGCVVGAALADLLPDSAGGSGQVLFLTTVCAVNQGLIMLAGLVYAHLRQGPVEDAASVEDVASGASRK